MKRKPDSDTDSEPSAKRQKTTQPKPKPPADPIPFTPDEVKQLLRVFKHLESQKIQNHTLDRCLFDSYKSYSNTLNTDQSNTAQSAPTPTAFEAQLKDIVVSKTIFPSNVFIEQLIQLKAQTKAIRFLSRDMGLSSTLSDIAHGIDNPHSWQRPYIDPSPNAQNPCISAHSKYNLNAKKQAINRDDEIIVDNSPQTVEQLVYQTQYDAHKKLVHRRRMLRDYVSHCESVKASKKKKANKNKKQHGGKQFDVSAYNKTRDELQSLELYELQQKVRKEVVHSRLDKYVYDCDNGEHEALLDPDLFARTGQVGLHFDPHVNSANHPPSMAVSMSTFPFYYQGRK